MKRRDFIKSSIIVGSTSGLLSSCSVNDDSNSLPVKNYISGFIFSDAHIGWRGADQPTVKDQSKAIQTIKKRFPNLDLVFDTGDIHHGYLNEKERNEARNHWLTEMANQFPNSLFHYIVGNHELGKGPFDTELTAAKIGSMNFRPYYSFDYKGIHFISLPELTDTILINKESLRWLEHDLLMSHDKTTLIFSHNSIAGTTFSNGETSYRVIINSQELIDVIDRHPNVIGWFHGHNHQYEVVNKDNRLYVSNGRMGGFNPPDSWGPFGQGHLGGIYFEINKERLLVRCYSATEDNFFDQIGFSNLTNSINKQTTHNKFSECNYYFGHGQLSDNVKYYFKNYYLSNYSAQLYYREHGHKVINDNDDFGFTNNLFFAGREVNRLIGYQVLPSKTIRKTVDEGLLITQKDNSAYTILKFPKQHFTSKGFMVRGSYFRCASGDRFHIDSEVIGENSNSLFEIKFMIYDEFQNMLFESKYSNVKSDISHNYQTDIIVPKTKSNNVTAKNKYIKFSVRLTNFPKSFIISKMAVSKKIERNKPTSLIVNDQLYNASELKGNIFQIKPTLNFIKYKGVPSSIIFKIPKVNWQIRNAIAKYSENTINVTEYTHGFQINKEVIITPTTRKKYFINKTINLMPYKITYLTDCIKIKIFEINKNSLIVLKTHKNPSKMIGAKFLNKNNSEMFLKPITSEVLIGFD